MAIEIEQDFLEYLISKYGTEEKALEEYENEYNIVMQKHERFKAIRYQLDRKNEYPNITEFVDAWVKQDEVAIEAYRQKCLEVKTKYPKPEGVPDDN